MSKMIQLVQEMHARLNDIANSEQALVRTLGDALSRVDQQLMQEVRNITAEHEARRSAILLELESLASRIGTFPTLREPVAGMANSQHLAKPNAPANGRLGPLDHGPWPPVASDMQHEVDLYFSDHAHRTEQRKAAAR
jgi:hypothetical protein